MDKIIQGTNSSLLGLFAMYLIARGDISPLIISIPAISAIKYVYLSNRPDRYVDENQWAHYLAWFLTTPVMLWLIFSLNNVPFLTSLILLILNQIMIATGYLAAEEKDDTKSFDMFILGCLAFLPIVYELIRLEKGWGMIFITLITWSLYPFVWYASRSNLMTIPLRNVLYSFLDFTSKAGLIVAYLLEIGKLKISF
jgi:bacteriorhodopsin